MRMSILRGWALTDIRANDGDLLDHTIIDEYGRRLFLRSYDNPIRSFNTRRKSAEWIIEC